MFKNVMENPHLNAYILGLKPGKLESLSKAADEEGGRPTAIDVTTVQAQAFERLVEDKENEEAAVAGPDEAAASRAGAHGDMQVGSVSEARTPDVQAQAQDDEPLVAGASDEGAEHTQGAD